MRGCMPGWVTLLQDEHLYHQDGGIVTQFADCKASDDYFHDFLTWVCHYDGSFPHEAFKSKGCVAMHLMATIGEERDGQTKRAAKDVLCGRFVGTNSINEGASYVT